MPAKTLKFCGETRLAIDATSHHTMRSSGTLHVKHLVHSSEPAVLEKSSHALARSNSYRGLPMPALSGSLLSITSPVSGLRVRPLLVTALPLGALKSRLPVREFIVASMIAAKRPMMMFREKKVETSAAASGPLKHVCSTHSS